MAIARLGNFISNSLTALDKKCEYLVLVNFVTNSGTLCAKIATDILKCARVLSDVSIVNNRYLEHIDNKSYGRTIALMTGIGIPFIYCADSKDAGKSEFKKGAEYSRCGKYSHAARCFKRAEEWGNAAAITQLGKCYQKLQKYSDKIEPLFERARLLGDAEGIYCLAEQYTRHGGHGLKDISDLYKEAADKGYPVAMYAFGQALMSGTVGVKADAEEAIKYFTLAAEKGHVESMRILGQIYFGGKCGGTDIDKDYSKALACYLNAIESQPANQDYYTVGQLYATGGNGINVDDAKALKYFKAGAFRGDPNALYVLGGAYQTGKLGLKVNYDEARNAFFAAAKKHHQDALEGLKNIYEELLTNKSYDILKAYCDNDVFVTPLSSFAYYCRGRMAEAEMKYEIAKIAYEAAITDETEGVAYNDRNQARESLKKIYESALKDPNFTKLALGWCKEEGLLENGDAYLFLANHFAASQDAEQYAQAHEWYKKAILAGSQPAKAALLDLYKACLKEKDWAKYAIVWCKDDTSLNDPQILCRLGEIYRDGFGTIENDWEVARVWYKKAAERNSNEAIAALKGMYLACMEGQEWYEDILKWCKEDEQDEGPFADFAKGCLGRIYQEGLGVDCNHDTAAQYYQDACENGEPFAAGRLGKMWLDGYNLESKAFDYDVVKASVYLKYAIELFNIGVKGGDVDSMIWLAELYQTGQGAELNIKKAVELYQTAADKGSDIAQVRLGSLYENGFEGQKPDYKKAADFYAKASAKGNASAKGRLGYLYEMGRIGGKVDYDRVAALYKEAIEIGDGFSSGRLGWLYEKEHIVIETSKDKDSEDEIGDEIVDITLKGSIGLIDPSLKSKDPNYQKAVELYQVGVDLDDAFSAYRLGWMYQNGLGVDVDKNFGESLIEQSYRGSSFGKGVGNSAIVEKNPKKAARLYEKAAKGGNPEAAYRFALMLEHGRGVDRDILTALEFFKSAADKGYPMAIWKMGRFYEKGLFDKGKEVVKQDLEKALSCYQKAAKQDVAEANYSLGKMYLIGREVKKNETIGLEFLMQAVKLGDLNAIYDMGNYKSTEAADMYGVGNFEVAQKLFQEAFSCFIKAAEKGHVDSMKKVSSMYMHGIGVDQNQAQYSSWINKSYMAEEGEAQDMKMSLVFDSVGFNKFPKCKQVKSQPLIMMESIIEQNTIEPKGETNEVEELAKQVEELAEGEKIDRTWLANLIKDISKDDLVSHVLFALGKIYMDDVLRKDDAKAEKCLLKAAENGYAEAMNALAKFYGPNGKNDSDKFLYWTHRYLDTHK